MEDLKIVFSDGTIEAVDGIFLAYESAGTSDFANQLGVVTSEKSISVDINQQTNINGLFAAGDWTGVSIQIATAIGQGAIAGKGILEYVRSIRGK